MSKKIIHTPSAISALKHLKEPIGILGYGVEGKSSVRFLQQHGIQNIQIFDQKKPISIPNQVSYSGDFKDHIPQNIKTLIRSAGVRWDAPVLQNFKDQGGILTSQIELFFDLVPAQNIIGVTGTLGKGTCCSLLYQILKKDNRSVYLGGNIGIPALDLLDHITVNSHVILELSSFQLSTLRRSPHIAVILKTTSEHLDWHLSHAEYLNCKSHLIRYQKKEDWVIYYKDQLENIDIVKHSPGKHWSIGSQGRTPITKSSWQLSEQTLFLKDHVFQAPFFLQNIAAAAAVAQILQVEESTIQSTCLEFPGLEHRLEPCGQTSQYVFINDSYATRPDATLGAIEAFSDKPKGTVGLILGGSDKHADFHTLLKKILTQDSIHFIALIGSIAPRLKKSFEEYSQSTTYPLKNISSFKNLETAFQFLIDNIPTGTILLSPACASFGLFRDYKHRGDYFKELVKNYISKYEYKQSVSKYSEL